jgi:hypothetical protein
MARGLSRWREGGQQGPGDSGGGHVGLGVAAMGFLVCTMRDATGTEAQAGPFLECAMQDVARMGFLVCARCDACQGRRLERGLSMFARCGLREIARYRRGGGPTERRLSHETVVLLFFFLVVGESVFQGGGGHMHP